MLLLFTIANGSRFQIGLVRGMKLFLYWSCLQTFECSLFHGGFYYFFSRGSRKVAGGFQCGHLQLDRIMSNHVLFSFALVSSILGQRVGLWQFQGLYYCSFLQIWKLSYEYFLVYLCPFFRWGFHAPDAYSRWGLTMAVYSVSLMDFGHLPKFRCINPRAQFALLVQFSICLVHYPSSCSSTARCL